MISERTFLHIARLLNSAEIEQVGLISNGTRYEDGTLTASGIARAMKNNWQMNDQSGEYLTIQQILLYALNRKAFFCNAVFPQHFYSFLISKYGSGLSYGWHLDSLLKENLREKGVEGNKLYLLQQHYSNLLRMWAY